MHHLAGIGHLLGSVIQSPLSQWTYLQVRNVLLAMVDLLASLESVLSSNGTSETYPGIGGIGSASRGAGQGGGAGKGGGSARLKAHVARIDQYMTNAALERQRGSQVYHSALPKGAWAAESVNPSVSSCGRSAPTLHVLSERARIQTES